MRAGPSVLLAEDQPNDESLELLLELQDFLVGLRVAEPHPLEGIDDRARDVIVARLLVVGWHDIPRRPRRAAQTQRIAIRLRVLVPEVAVDEIAGAELPVLRRVRE